MKKWSMLLLTAALALWPMAGLGEEAADLMSALKLGVGEGLAAGAAALENAEQELTLELSADAEKIEEGHTQRLTVTAGNPLPRKAKVSFTLALPDRLSCAQPLEWEAELDAAAYDPVTGAIVPSVMTFTRDVMLTAGGESEQADVRVEMAMGTRFYRAQQTLSLCVPDISANAVIDGIDGDHAQPGDAFAYRLEIVNAGTAAKDVPVEMIVPEGATLLGALPVGFEMKENSIFGVVRAEAAGDAAAALVLRFPMQVKDDALEGDEDAIRLLGSVLTVDGARVAAPRLLVCGPKISARLIPEADSLEEGEEMALSILLVNSGLAAADVKVSCLLPEGLTVVKDKAEAKAEQKAQTAATPDEATPDEAAPLAAMDDGGSVPPAPAAQAVMGEASMQAEQSEETGALVYSVHMDAAKQTEAGVSAATQVIKLRVQAETPQENLGDRLLGAALAWQVDESETQLGEAVAVRVTRAGFLGMSQEDWNGVLVATLLLIVTVCCLYAAVKSDEQEEYVFE